MSRGAIELNNALPITPSTNRTVRNVGIDAIIEAPTATATAEASPPRVEVQASDEAALEEDSEVAKQDRAVADELVVQGFILSWMELTASPVIWIAQVFDGDGEEIVTGVGDDPVEILAGLADRLLPHHPG